MMLSRFVRIQLIIFSILTVVGLVVMSVVYVQLPAMFGIGRYQVTTQLAATGGLYPHANVTYRGTNVGEVEDVRLTPAGVDAILSIDSDYKIPADTHASVKSVSAIGEQYVDLIPTGADSGPDLADGDVIPEDRTTLPQDVGPLLDQADRLLAGIADTRLETVIDEAFDAFNGSGPDLGRFIDSAQLFLQQASADAEPTKQLIDQLGPLLDTQTASADAIRSWTRDLVTVTDQLRAKDPQLRSIIERAPGATTEAQQLFEDLRPTLPLLLANMVSVGQVTTIYHKGLEQILVVYPALVAALKTAIRGDAAAVKEGAIVDFMLETNDPPPCVTGFLPGSEWRDGSQVDVIPTPDNLFCKVPQNAVEDVRGARNTPCMEFPGKRAPSPEVCRSPEGYVPLGTNPAFGDPQPVPGGQLPTARTAPAGYEPGSAARQYDAATGIFVGPDGRTYT